MNAATLDPERRQAIERLSAEAKTLPPNEQTFFHKNADRMIAWDDQNRAEQEWQQRLAKMNPIRRFFAGGGFRHTAASTIPFLIFGGGLYAIGRLIFTFLPASLLPTAWVCWTLVLVGLILAQRLDRLTEHLERLSRRP